jgi:transcription elongation GreA/GreB family factor
MTKFYFLRDDLNQLAVNIREVAERVRTVQQDMAVSVGQSSETWHDNFGYEDGRRQFAMWSKRLSELQEIRSCAVAVEPTNNCERVAIGSRVTFEDTATGNRRTIRIGSYMSFSNAPDTISYTAPLARIFLGAAKGQEVSGVINGRMREFFIVSINC